MLTLPRPSFRQLLLVALLLLAGLLAAVALRGLASVENLLASSRSGAQRSLALNAHVDRLNEQGLTMERAARQGLVLLALVLLAAGMAGTVLLNSQELLPGAQPSPGTRGCTWPRWPCSPCSSAGWRPASSRP